MEDEQVTVTPAHRETTGRELYEFYVDYMAQQQVEVDHWIDIGPQEQRAWDALAEGVLLKEYLG